MTINIAEKQIQFECHYPRTVDISPFQFEVSGVQSEPVIGVGKFDYKMTINTGYLGESTTVQISPNHGFSQISAE